MHSTLSEFVCLSARMMSRDGMCVSDQYTEGRAANVIKSEPRNFVRHTGVKKAKVSRVSQSTQVRLLPRLIRVFSCFSAFDWPCTIPVRRHCPSQTVSRSSKLVCLPPCPFLESTVFSSLQYFPRFLVVAQKASKT